MVRGLVPPSSTMSIDGSLRVIFYARLFNIKKGSQEARELLRKIEDFVERVMGFEPTTLCLGSEPARSNYLTNCP